MRIALVVNPLAGMGGAAGLFGTDGAETAARAALRGAQPTAVARATRAMVIAAAGRPAASVLCGPGRLGEESLTAAGLVPVPATGFAVRNTAEDTREVIRRLGPVDLVLVAGGDGTARDVLEVLPAGTPVLGIPCGSKMQSGIFARSPEAAGRILADILRRGRLPPLQFVEVADLDEVALREGVIAPRVWGQALVPALHEIAGAKGRMQGDPEADLQVAAADAVAGQPAGTMFLLGPGRSAKLVGRVLGHDLSPMGVDAVADGRLLGRGLSQDRIRALAAAHRGPLRMVLGVIGGQGVLIGRGNREIPPDLLSLDRLVVLATAARLATLSPPVLTVDTGDPAVDLALAGFIRVQTGPGRQMLMRIAAG